MASNSPATSECLLPRPRSVRLLQGVLRLAASGFIQFVSSDKQAILAARRMWSIHAPTSRFKIDGGRGTSSRSKNPITIESGKSSLAPKGYELRVASGGIRVSFNALDGLRYALITLAQLLSSGANSIRCMHIKDGPDFPVRGMMLDISRDKVPTMATLRRLIDLFASWKINHLQLYMEHSFAYRGHEEVWRGASPMTGAQIKSLDRYCRDRGIELVPNQNSFGHMERWLKHPRYAPLAEVTGPWKSPWGDIRHKATTLNPLDPRSIRLVADLFKQLVPHFSSRLLNVGCDETFELGQGRSSAACKRLGLHRVYLDFLLKIYRLVKASGHQMMMWADGAMQHPRIIAKLPSDVIPLIWGYEADEPFDRQCRLLRQRGLEFYICPGTSSWCSFAGRTMNFLANIASAAKSGLAHGAKGLLITDWGDFGHRQYEPTSYAGFLYGAAMAWSVKTNVSINVGKEISRHIFNDPTGTTGRLWCEAGQIHELSGISLKNKTILFNIMQGKLGDGAVVEKLSPPSVHRMLRCAADLRKQTIKAPFKGEEGKLARAELIATLDVLSHAAKRGLFGLAGRSSLKTPPSKAEMRREMESIMHRHRTLWLARNRRGGLTGSLAYYQRNLDEYK